VADLLQTAKHGPGDHVYLIRFHYIPPGGWERTNAEPPHRSRSAQATRGRLS
jgi:hypothetical protein